MLSAMRDHLLPCVELETGPGPAAAVVWLHGLGANGHDFEPIVPLLGLPKSLPVRFVFPHAPSLPVTINGGMVMPAWYDIADADFDRRGDEDGIRASAARIEALLARERERGIADDRIVLAGFSQGGAIALHVALRRAAPLAGVMALSTYLALERTAAAESSEAGRRSRVFMAHGRFDPVVPLEYGARSRDVLARLGCSVEWREYPMQHQVCDEEIRDIGDWLKGRFLS